MDSSISSYLSEIDFLLSLEFVGSARLGGQRALEIILVFTSPALRLLAGILQAFLCVLSIKSGFSRLYGKPFAGRTTALYFLTVGSC